MKGNRFRTSSNPHDVTEYGQYFQRKLTVGTLKLRCAERYPPKYSLRTC
jgi:hypothetical protein